MFYYLRTTGILEPVCESRMSKFCQKYFKWLTEQSNVQPKGMKNAKVPGLIFIRQPWVISKLILAGSFVTIQPTNQRKLVKKGKTFLFYIQKGCKLSPSSPNWGRGILKDHICVFHGALGNGLLWDNIKTHFPLFFVFVFVFPKEGYFLCRGVSPNGVQISPWRNHSNTLEIDIHV